MTNQSSIVKVNIAFNQYDGSFLIEIGRLNETLYPLNDEVIKELFHYSLSVEKVRVEGFIQNLSILFQTAEVVEMLMGNIKSLEDFITRQSENYTLDY